MKGAHLYMELLHQSLNHPMPHRTGHNANECLESLLNLEGMVAHVNRLIKQALVKCGPCPPSTTIINPLHSKIKRSYSLAHIHIELIDEKGKISMPKLFEPE